MLEHDPTLAINVASFCVLLFVLAGIRHFSRHSILPSESWILLAGLLYGMVVYHFDTLPALHLTPELVFALLLPILIFSSARTLSPTEVEQHGLHVGFLATFGVAITIFMIGMPLHWLMDIPLIHAMLLAASVAATDPSAVNSIFQRFRMPEELTALLEGESLFNDGTAIVAFLSIAVVALSAGELHAGELTLQLLWTLGAAVPLGMVLGWMASKLILVWYERNHFAELSLSLVLAFGSFLLAENLLHISGVVTTMFAAWAYIRVRGKPTKKESFSAYWNYLNELAGSVLFFILGVTAGLHQFPLSWAIPGVIVILLVSRASLIYGSGLLFRVVGQPLPTRWQHILTLGGLRGAVSCALVLMIPVNYPYREDMLCLVLVLCLFTLVINPAVLQIYLRKNHL
ncbi:cation:proton antiporter [Hahella ganghwensis]|uniref:cation:proton antiporter n=1 Tax=Hahella ganghwensis TaxID=286420 RepID=UPI000370180C|nr:sodium:proton antiporter [Hahella ganghwensis]